MKSNLPSAMTGSRARAQNRRTCGSISAIRFGVKTRLSRLRCTSCAGGSSNRMMPGGISMPLRMSSSTDPLPEMYVFQSVMHSRTSSNRLKA